MSWLAWLIIGLLIGWLVEWLIDYFFWRDACKQNAAALVQRERDLDARELRMSEDDKNSTSRQAEWDARHRGLLDALAQREASFALKESDLKVQQGGLSDRLSEFESRSSALSKRTEDLAARDTHLQRQLQEIDLRTAQANAALARLQAADGELFGLRAQAARLGEIVRQRYQTKTGADDIEVVEGIGPKIAELLHADGIYTFRELALVPVARLSAVLEAGGPRFKLANPGTWSEQARLLADGDFVAFEKLKAELTAGVRVAPDTHSE